MREAKFKDVYEDLQRGILSGVYPLGLFLPSLPSLAEKYATSRPTIRKALQILEQEGLVSCRNGIGVVVTNPAEQLAKTRRPLEIGVDLLLSESNYFNYALPIMSGLNRASEKYDFNLRILKPSELEKGRTREDFPDGIILYSLPGNAGFREVANRITDAGVPLVLLNRSLDNPKVGMLAVDYRKEARRAVSCMIRNGAKRIACYRNPPDLGNVLRARVQGWRDAYLENNLPVPEELCITEGNYAEANRKLSDLLASEVPDMIFITNGSCFYQVCTILARENLSVPGDLALLCFDDIGALAEDLGIPASYLRMPLEQMAFEAAESIVLLKNTPAGGVLPRRSVDTELIVKGCRFLLSPSDFHPGGQAAAEVRI